LIRKNIIFVGLIFLFIFNFIGGQALQELPERLSIIENDSSIFNLSFPGALHLLIDKTDLIEINGESLNEKLITVDSSRITLKGKNTGETDLYFKLFGLIPLRRVKLNVLPSVSVMPGGQAIGVLMRTEGVIVVGRAVVYGTKGNRYSPARKQGIEPGDILLSVNGTKIKSKGHLADLIQQFGKQAENLNFIIRKKSGALKEISVNAVKNKDNQYLIGLYIDDGIAGVGTLTFYDKKTKEYGALGHVIIESHSKSKIKLKDGRIIEASITGIQSGRNGIPGEKLGAFYPEANILGNIKKNCDFGIYGKLERPPVNNYFKEEIPIAAISEVNKGPASIYTVIEGGDIEKYKINIDRVYQQGYPSSKGMIISIVDKELKSKTGGIIQGMSGSPIVQNGKLIGAVTHVFINNPLRGYGIFAEWMLMETNIYNNRQFKAAN